MSTLFLLALLSLLCCAQALNPAISTTTSSSNSLVYNQTRAYYSLLLSYTTYCGENVTPTFNCWWCDQVNAQGSPFKYIGHFGNVSGSAYFGFVGYNPVHKKVYLSFRGTVTLDGWVYDFSFELKPYGEPAPADARCHRGFHDAYIKVQSRVRTLVDQARAQCGSDCALAVTGHSLGAALSAFGTLDAIVYSEQQNRPWPSIEVFNFGQPRVGNQAFANWLHTSVARYNADAQGVNYWRLTWENDPVPRLPMADTLGELFHHAGREVHYTRKQQYSVCNGSGEDQKCGIDSVPAFLLDPIDHLYYMKRFAGAGLLHGCLFIPA